MFNYLVKKKMQIAPKKVDIVFHTTVRLVCSKLRRSHLRRRQLKQQSNIDGRSQAQAEGGSRRDVLLTDLVAIQSQRLQSGEVGHVREGAKAF